MITVFYFNASITNVCWWYGRLHIVPFKKVLITCLLCPMKDKKRETFPIILSTLRLPSIMNPIECFPPVYTLENGHVLSFIRRIYSYRIPAIVKYVFIMSIVFIHSSELSPIYVSHRTTVRYSIGYRVWVHIDVQESKRIYFQLKMLNKTHQKCCSLTFEYETIGYSA